MLEFPLREAHCSAQRGARKGLLLLLRSVPLVRDASFTAVSGAAAVRSAPGIGKDKRGGGSGERAKC